MDRGLRFDHPSATGPGRRMLGVAAAVAVLAAAVATPLVGALAAVEPTAEPIAIDYRAPEGCPAEQVFADQLFGRTRRARPAGAGESVRSFRVTIEAAGHRLRGELAVWEKGKRRSDRTMTARSCEELVEALALSAALAVDPEANAAPWPVLADASAPEAERDASREGALGDGDAEAAVGTVIARGGEDAALEAGSALGDEGAVRSESIGIGVGATGALRSGLAPGTHLGLGAYAEASSSARALLSPSLRLSILYAPLGAYEIQGLEARFSWWALAASACPARWRPASSALVATCARIELGRTAAEATRADRAQAQALVWAAVGPELRLEWAPWSWGPVVGLEAGALFPLVRASYFFSADGTNDGGLVLHATPALAAHGALDLGARFP